MNSTSRLVVVVAALVVAGGALLLWRQRHAGSPAALVAAPTPIPPAPPVAPGSPMAPRPPAIRYPIERAPVAPPPLSAAERADTYFKDALIDLLGSKAVLSFLVTDSFAQRFVATVNALATHEAASELWPVRPVAGAFEVEPGAGAAGGGDVIGAANAARYGRLVRLAEAIDTRRAVALYVRAYPLLQQAYEDLGFPGQYFNDRAVDVIDHLLATPEAAQPPRVKRVEVSGAPPAARGGGLYVFQDPALESRSTGQKILLRIGPANAARLKAKLAEIRQAIAAAPPPK